MSFQLLATVFIVGIAMTVQVSAQFGDVGVCDGVIESCLNDLTSKLYIGISRSQACKFASGFTDCLASSCSIFEEQKDAMAEILQDELNKYGIHCGAWKATYSPLAFLCLALVIVKTVIFKM